MKLQFSSTISLVWVFLLKEVDELKIGPGGGDEEIGQFSSGNIHKKLPLKSSE